MSAVDDLAECMVHDMAGIIHVGQGESLVSPHTRESVSSLLPGFRVSGLGFRVSGSGFRVKVQGFGSLPPSGIQLRTWGCGGGGVCGRWRCSSGGSSRRRPPSRRSAVRFRW